MASCCAGVITPSISCRSRWRICWICCRFCCIESDEFAHTASTCWRACCVIIRRCWIADLETPATSQQGSSRGCVVVPGAVEGLVRMGAWAVALSASAAERMIPASSAESTVLFHGIKSLLRKTQTQLSLESCTAIYKIEIAKPFNHSQDGAKRNDIIKLCSHLTAVAGA